MLSVRAGKGVNGARDAGISLAGPRLKGRQEAFVRIMARNMIDFGTECAAIAAAAARPYGLVNREASR